MLLAMQPRPLILFALITNALVRAAEPLTQTAPLTAEGDLAAQMVGGIDRYLDRVTAETPARRRTHWTFNPSSNDAFFESYLASAATNRIALRELLGVVDQREPVTMRFVAPVGPNFTTHPGELARGPGYRVFGVAWNVFRGVEGEGLLLIPDGEQQADVASRYATD